LLRGSLATLGKHARGLLAGLLLAGLRLDGLEGKCRKGIAEIRNAEIQTAAAEMHECSCRNAYMLHCRNADMQTKRIAEI
jgi:hypothetical protein